MKRIWWYLTGNRWRAQVEPGYNRHYAKGWSCYNPRMNTFLYHGLTEREAIAMCTILDEQRK